MEGAKVKIRGIYATALSWLFHKKGFTIVESTLPVRKRLGIDSFRGQEEVNIFDRQDKQGIIIEGHREKVELVGQALRESLPEAICRSLTPVKTWEELQGAKLSWAEFQKLGRDVLEVEFPLSSKLTLDELRRETSPTLPAHHLLKIMDSQRVEEAEEQLQRFPQKDEELAHKLKMELIYQHYREGRPITIFHTKLEGSPIELKGLIKEVLSQGKIRVERKFKGGGSYDGLGVPKEEGDWGIIEIEEGSWYSLFSYYSPDDTLKGRIYNINTPVEFYSDAIRYFDLEIDVVEMPDGQAKIIDREKLEEKVSKGIIGKELARKASSIAEGILHQIGMVPKA